MSAISGSRHSCTRTWQGPLPPRIKELKNLLDSAPGATANRRELVVGSIQLPVASPDLLHYAGDFDGILLEATVDRSNHQVILTAHEASANFVRKIALNNLTFELGDAKAGARVTLLGDPIELICQIAALRA